MKSSTDDAELAADATDVQTDEDIEYQAAQTIDAPSFVPTDFSLETHRVVGVARTHGSITVRIGSLGPSGPTDGEAITS